MSDASDMVVRCAARQRGLPPPQWPYSDEERRLMMEDEAFAHDEEQRNLYVPPSDHGRWDHRPLGRLLDER